MKPNNELKTFAAGAGWIILFLILFLLALMSSCTPQLRCIEKPYIAVKVSEQFTGTVYTFVNFTYTEGKQFFEPEPAKCVPGDTARIKTCKKGLFGKTTILTIYK